MKQLHACFVYVVMVATCCAYIHATCTSCDLKSYLSELKEQVTSLECMASKMNQSISILVLHNSTLANTRTKQYVKILNSISQLKDEMNIISNSQPYNIETVVGAVDSETIVVDARMPNGNVAKTCKEYFQNYPTWGNGVYFIKPFNDEPEFKVFCDMKNGGYTLFQKRISGDVDFYRNWGNYTKGFGDERTSYWLGLEKISKFTQQYNCRLRVELYNADQNTTFYENYETFSVGAAETLFTLAVGNPSGTLGDSLAFHSGHQFSTFDNDNDTWNGNGAELYHGAYWYASGHWSNLNGDYSKKGVCSECSDGINWYSHLKHDYSYEKTAMGMMEE